MTCARPCVRMSMQSHSGCDFSPPATTSASIRGQHTPAATYTRARMTGDEWALAYSVPDRLKDVAVVLPHTRARTQARMQHTSARADKQVAHLNADERRHGGGCRASIWESHHPVSIYDTWRHDSHFSSRSGTSRQQRRQG